MADDVNDIAHFYNQNPEAEDKRLVDHQLEYDLTWRYLERYMPAQGTILEIGAATGRYTLALAKRGYQVTAVDLSAALLEMNKEKLNQAGLAGKVQWIVADARDLRKVPRIEYDAALVMGPLYHLIEETDRRQALGEASDRLQAGGIIFSAFLSRLGVLGDLIKNTPAWIEGQADVRSLLEKGRRPETAPRGGFRGYFARVEEIAPLHEALGFETLVFAGVEPAISADDESYNKLQGQLRQRWLDVLFDISTTESSVGASRHILYIGKKK